MSKRVCSCVYLLFCIYEHNAVLLLRNACWPVTEPYSNQRALHCAHCSFLHFHVERNRSDLLTCIYVSIWMHCFWNFFFCLHYCVVRILGSGLPLWGAHPSGWLPFKYVGHRSLTTSLAQLFLLWLIGSSSLTLSACRFNWWLHGRTGCVGGAVTSEGRASDESRAGASGELRIQKKN